MEHPVMASLGREAPAEPAHDVRGPFPPRSLARLPVAASVAAPGVIRLHTLGRLELVGADGRELRGILVQPKRLALLIYLAVAEPGRYHWREGILARFWPDLPPARASVALRKQVHFLRRALGAHALERRGRDELRLAPGAVWCDASAFQHALAEGDLPRALGLYRGPFLEAFYAPSAPGFEQWLEAERTALERRAADAAGRLAEAEERRGHRLTAALWARWALALAPLEEVGLRRLLALLARLGDRAGALEAYTAFTTRLAAELALAPSAETLALVREIRDGTG
jgi:DNA-binding SARP family transcriptional activator